MSYISIIYYKNDTIIIILQGGGYVISHSMVFNNHTLNIFTDASIRRMNDGEVIGCPGALLFKGRIQGELKPDKVKTKIIRNSTSNNAEINAVKLGVELALEFRDNDTRGINLMSDSKLCIYGLREWIFNWVNQSPGDVLIGSTGQEVSNQNEILQIIYMILNNDLNINFYHQNGHININNMNQLQKAKDTFINSNFIQQDVNLDVIRTISSANNIVDELTRNILKDDSNILIPITDPMIHFTYNKFDVCKYTQLLNLRRE